MKRTTLCEEYYILSFKELQKELGITESIKQVMTNKNKQIKIVVFK